MLDWYADLVGGPHHPHVHVIRDTPGRTSGDGRTIRHDFRTSVDALRNFSMANDIGLLLADWTGDTDRLQTLLFCAAELDVPAVFVRQSRIRGIRRVMVATSGGPHTLQQMWVAKEISNRLAVPMRVLRLLLRDSDRAPVDASVETWTPRLLGATAKIETYPTSNLVREIANCVCPGDLLVMGAPSPFHVVGTFAESIPAKVADSVSNPVVLLNSRRPKEITLRGIFWGGLARVGARPRDKEAAISELVEALVRHNQVSRSSKADLVDRAMQRERFMSSAIDCETAFPHIRMPDFRGVAGSMEICPNGVAFGSPDGSLTRFIYLLITPEGFCDEHLSILAKIGKRMVRPEVRCALLKCNTPQKVMYVLEPRPGADMDICGVFRG